MPVVDVPQHGLVEFPNEMSDEQISSAIQENYADLNPKYDTKLTPSEETKFQDWKKVNAPKDSGADYDLRGAFKAGLSPAQNGHWPDTFKKPNHPTFSNESIYAKDRPDLVGHWVGETYVPPGSPSPLSPEDMKKVDEQFKNRIQQPGKMDIFGPETTDTTEAIGRALYPSAADPNAPVGRQLADVAMLPIRVASAPYALIPKTVTETGEKIGADLLNIPFIGLGMNPPIEPGKQILPKIDLPENQSTLRSIFNLPTEIYNQAAEMTTPGNVLLAKGLHDAGTLIESRGQNAPTGTPEANKTIIEPDQIAPLAPLTAEALKQTAGKEFSTPKVENDLILQIQKNREELDNRARAFGASDVRQFNTQNAINSDSLPPEQRQLLEDYAAHNNSIRSLKWQDAAKLSDGDFGIWEKPLLTERASQESDITDLAKLHLALERRGNADNAFTVLENLKNSKRRDNLTLEEWNKSNPDEPMTQSEIDKRNEDSKDWNDLIDTAVETINRLKTGEPNASTIKSSEPVSQHEVRPPVGESPPLRQQPEEPASPQANEPSPQSVPPPEQATGSKISPTRELIDLPLDGILDWKKRVVLGTKSIIEMAKTSTPEEIAQAITLRDELRNQASENLKQNGLTVEGGLTSLKAQSLNEIIETYNDLKSGTEIRTGPRPMTEDEKQQLKSGTWKGIPETTPEMAGMGGAKYGEVGTTGNPDVYGIAERVRAERAKAGQVEEVPPGQGISAPESVEHGRELLKADPNAAESALTQFESDKRISSDAMAAVRAKGEELALEARKTEQKFGTDSDEYRNAFKTLSDWDTRTKAMQTEWHKAGMAQQGETDIDTGSFTGLARAFKSDTGKDFTPSQESHAKGVAEKVTKATKETDTARTELVKEVQKTGAPSEVRTNAEKKAIDAANKTVREAAARMAESENKARVAELERKQATEDVQRKAEEKAIAASNKTIRESAIRNAKEEIKKRSDEAGRRQAIRDVQEMEKQDALDAANKTVRDAAAKRALDESKARVKAAEKALKYAKQDRAREQKIIDAKNKEIRDLATKAAQREAKLQANPDVRVWNRAKEYLSKGVESFDELRNKIATDLGMTVGQVTRWLTYSKRAKYLADDLWQKQQKERLLKEQAKRWLKDAAIPGWKRAISSVPRILFSLKVGFHGTVALGTHAPTVIGRPMFWKTYVENFGKMYRMVGSRAYYEMQVQDLLRKPNYIMARRAGLVNDPYQFEDLNSPDTSKYITGLTQMGNRGYSVLKMLRQDMFDEFWNRLPESSQIPEFAKEIADGVNHSTGVVKGSAPAGSHVVLFAPRLAASRVMWLAGDPLKAVDTFARWKEATPAEKYFAINQVKEKAWVAGTLYGLLALNQGFLSATGSNQKVNLTDPFHSDFLKFKVAGMNFSYGNAMLSMARLPVRLYKIRESNGGKLKNLVFPDEDTYSVLGEYGRSQLSPFASLALTLWLKGDWQNRPLPSSERPVPKRLRAQGVKPYTWPEFWSEQMLPIPAEEAAKEVWKHGLGMSDQQISDMRKALATIAVMSATGGRLEEDIPYKTEQTKEKK